jgi:hypothetical protein
MVGVIKERATTINVAAMITSGENRDQVVLYDQITYAQQTVVDDEV